MNKKGDLFMLGLDILFLIAIVFLFWKLSASFQQHNTGEEIGTRQMATLHTYAVSEQMLLYLDTAAKYAAYEAFETFFTNGAINPVDSPCGTYASYLRWTAPGKSCIPSDTEIEIAFSKELETHLRNILLFPGLPMSAYSFVFERTGSILRIHALTQDEITLPIVAAKDSEQRLIKDVILGGNTKISKGTFPTDSSLPGVTVRPSENRRARTGALTHVVLHATGTENSADALHKYTAGTASTHYLVDKQGTVIQVVPEDQSARHSPDCEGCSVPDIEDVSISISLVNTLEETCDVNINGKCWEKYSSVQIEAFFDILIDILQRTGIRPENVITKEQLLQDENPGPAFLQAAGVSSYGDFIRKVAEEKSKKDVKITSPQGPQSRPDTGVSIVWPTESRVVTSCYGKRDYVPGNDKFHDGIDMGGSRDEVFAFAGGTVITACSSGCGSYGNHVVIKHSENLYSRYSHLSSVEVSPGYVSKGEILGRIGNTGNSQGAHLDFKIYTSSDLGSDKARNPLCLFEDSELQQLSFTGRNCNQFGFQDKKLTHAHPSLARDCSGLGTFSSQPACSLNTVSVDPSGDATLTKTLENLKDISGIMDEIKKAGDAEGVDHRLIIAFIAQESRGRANIVSATGCAGLGQFCLSTAKGYTSIFGSNFRQCQCNKGECTDEEAGCVGDPRFDPVKSVRAIPKLLKDKMKSFDESDRIRFGIAAYNGGEGTIRMAVDKTGKDDPTWEEVSAALDEEIIGRALCNPPNGYFCRSSSQTQKVREIRNYVPGVMKFYIALGGSTLSDFSDQICGEYSIKVKELGRYIFKPSFTTEVYDMLSVMREISSWANQTYSKCDGSGGKDNRLCLLEEKQKLNSDNIELVVCPLTEGEGATAIRFMQAVTDCRDNKQNDCYCTWNSQKVPDDERDMSVRLYGDVPHVLLDGVPVNKLPPGTPVAKYQEGIDDDPEDKIVDLYEDNGKKVRTWKAKEGAEGSEAKPFDKIDTSNEVEEFTMLKKNGEIVWTAETDLKPEDACGIYKTQYQICVRIKTPTYVISREETVNPFVKFGLHLEDKHKPPVVIDAEAIMQMSAWDIVSPEIGSLVGHDVEVTFKPSSEDTSYYIVKCKPVLGTHEETKKILGRAGAPLDKIKKDIELTMTCKGGTQETGYQITITPYDISGNEGDSLTITVKEQQNIPI